MIATGIIVVLLIIYVRIIRPRQLRWGATSTEVAFVLPGDGIVKKPDFHATRSISISAAAEEIWKWIVQIGSKRAGWYSIDWIDNANIPSSLEILPEFQNIEIGQFIPFTPDQKHGMWVKDYKPYEYILWTDEAGKATWLWYIYENEVGETRLITRPRTKYDWTSVWIVYYLLYDAGDIVMMKRCMKGIKERAEKRLNTKE